MSISGAIKEITQNVIKTSDLTDLSIGTVMSTNPLEISISPDMPNIPAAALLLTDSVIEKKFVIQPHIHQLPNLSHLHTTPNGNSGVSLGGTLYTNNAVQWGTFYNNNVEQDIDEANNTIYLNKGLQVGNRVLMLKIMGGQNYLVLSKIIGALNNTPNQG